MSENLPALAGEHSLATYTGNFDQSMRFASVLHKSGLVPASLKGPEAVYVAILWGQELGFSPIQAVNCIDVIQGRPTIPAATIKAIVLQHGGIIRTLEWTDKLCTLEMTRGTWIESRTYSIEDAQRAGLTGKDNWKKDTKSMLYARCVSILGRNMYADKLKGFYSKEEIQDGEYVEVTPAPRASSKLAELEAPVIVVEPTPEPAPQPKPAPKKKDKGDINNRKQALLSSFELLGVSCADLEIYCNCSIEDMNEVDLANLADVYKDIKKGAKPDEFFEMSKPAAAEVPADLDDLTGDDFPY